MKIKGTRSQRGARSALALAGICAIALGLEGCQPSADQAATAAVSAPTPYVKREGVSLADATIDVVSLTGAPDVARGEFTSALQKQFTADEIVAAAPGKARYLLRVYLSATPADGGANLQYVVDVYDPRRVRLARLSDGAGVNGNGDPWSLMTTATVESVATKCADDLAAFLSNAPEAKPTASAATSYVE